MPETLKALFAHIATNPTIGEDLKCLHDLALYESGDALLGEHEKDALRNAYQLSVLLLQISPDEFRKLL